jgi:hypothetical protein
VEIFQPLCKVEIEIFPLDMGHAGGKMDVAHGGNVELKQLAGALATEVKGSPGRGSEALI